MEEEKKFDPNDEKFRHFTKYTQLPDDFRKSLSEKSELTLKRVQKIMRKNTQEARVEYILLNLIKKIMRCREATNFWVDYGIKMLEEEEV